MKKVNKEKTEKQLTIKLCLCIVYLIVITILFVCSYKLFQAKYYARPWGEVESVDEYSYIKVSRMSEKFAYYEKENIGIHFVIEKEETGVWHTYLIAIDENEYDKYKEIIDYTYERTKEEPKPLKVYGYPEIIKTDLKNLAIKNIVNFVPSENEITITEDNFETYITNSYLDTTKEKKDYFSIILFITLILLFVMIALFIFTIFDKDKLLKKRKRQQKKQENKN
jgi:heme/copper-type cytochrome/quinol oxidase subunit 2